MESTEIVNEDMIQDAVVDEAPESSNDEELHQESSETWFDEATQEYYETGDLNMTEATVEDVTADGEPVPQDITGLAVLVFVTSMIVGIMIWNTLSRRWS